MSAYGTIGSSVRIRHVDFARGSRMDAEDTAAMDGATSPSGPRRFGHVGGTVRVWRVLQALLLVLVFGVITVTVVIERPASSVSSPDPATQPQWARFYQQLVRWDSCHPELRGSLAVQCATVMAPLDWAAADGATIMLHVVRHQATGGHRLGVLLMNPGGPGESAEHTAVTASDMFGDEIAASYDLIGWDPRGVGTSSAVQCPPDAGGVTFSIDEVPTTPAQIAAYQKRWRERGQACLATTGQLLRHVDTMSTVRDLDLLRGVLADPHLNFYGASYGTLIGTLYAETFPTRVGRVVLDSPEDPSLDMAGWQQGIARALDHGLTSYLLQCRHRPTCPFPGQTPAEAKTRIRHLLITAADHPLATNPPLDQADIYQAVRSNLVEPLSWANLDHTLAVALSVGTKPAPQAKPTEPTQPTTALATAFDAITCLDRPDHRTLDQVHADAVALDTAYPFGYLDGGSAADCLLWPVPPVLTSHRVTAPGAAPILIIGTVNDPATSYEWATSLTSQLTSSRLLTYTGDGHVATNRHNPCISTAVKTYYLNATLPPAGTTCTPQF